MTLKNVLEAEKLSAMKSKRGLTGPELDLAEARLAVVRAALTAIAKTETSFKERRELSDEEVISILRKEVAQRKESASMYAQASEHKRAEREEQEAAVLGEFLPAFLDLTATRELVATIIREQELAGPRAIGQVMGALKARTDVDKGLASSVARELL